MNRSVARADSAALPADAPAAPPLPPWVKRHVDAALEPDPARRHFLVSNLPALTDQGSRGIARSAAAVLDGWLAPAGSDVVARWLAPLVASVKGAPGSPALMAAFVASVVMLELPARAFTLEAQKEALRRWVFWPAAAEIEALLAPVGARWRSQRAVLLRLAESGEVERDAPPVLGAEERAAIVARFRVRYREEVLGPIEQRAAADRVRAVAARPAVLSEGALLESYRAIVAQGGPSAGAAAQRVRMIEERLGVQS